MFAGGDTHHKKRTANRVADHCKNSFHARGDFILKKIQVVDTECQLLDSTYIKRARQLVKKERAIWISDSTIQLTRPYREVNIVENTYMDAAGTVENGQTTVAETVSVEDKLVMELAKRRLAARRNLISQVFDLCLLTFVFALIVVNDSASFSFMIAFILLAFFGVRLIVRITRFIRFSFKEGIVAFFRKLEAQRLDDEISRLRKMSASAIAEELDK